MSENHPVGEPCAVVAASDLVATLPDRIAALFTNTLVCSPPPVELAPFHMAMAWHERMHEDVRHRRLRELLLAVAAEV